MAARRPQGKWHPLFHIISLLALPIIYSVYLGVAEAARERALALVRKRRPDEHLLQAVGEMENQVAAARILHTDWVGLAKSAQPGPEATAKIHGKPHPSGARGACHGRRCDGRRRRRCVFRVNGLERLFRDAQAERHHPLQEGLQKVLAARAALRMEI